jgi:hypothetical protein
MPALLRCLTAGESVSDGLCQPITLLFARTRQGRVYVVEVDGPVLALLEATDGQRDIRLIADHCRMSEAIAHERVAALGQIGAILAPLK